MRQKKSKQTEEMANQQSLAIRTGSSTESIKQSILDNLHFSQVKVPELATLNDWYMAVACAIRDRMLDNWTKTIKQLFRKDTRAVCYLSAEFLLGPHLANNIINLGIYKEVSQAVSDLGLDLEQLIAQEEEPGLGNGGLGRLAACYMDSLATLGIPALGYGIRYEFGIFDQMIRDGWQVEITDKWLQKGNPWEIVLFGLTTDEVQDMKSGGYNPRGFYESNIHLQEVIDQIGSGVFSKGDRELFRPLIDSLLNRDEYMLLADYQSYVDCQDRVSKAFKDKRRWTQMSILNVARMGKFSSDRSIREYCDNIWKVKSLNKK
jgi:glucan phosphorylase